MSRFLSRSLLAALATLMLIPSARAQDMLVLGSGEATGYYYPMAGAICRVINKDRQRHGLRCLVEPSGGSASNLAGLRAGEDQLALVQSRVLYQAVKGEGVFGKDGPMADLRSLAVLHGETLAVVVRKESKIRSLSDLKGKRVNLGRPGSFQRAMAEALLDGAGLKQGDLAAALEVEPGQQAKALCGGQLDAAVFTAVHPAPEVQEALTACGGMLLPLTGSGIDGMLKRTPWLVRQTIDGDTYRGLEREVDTFGPVTLLVGTDQLSDDQGKEVVRSVVENWDGLAALHPLFATIPKETLSTGERIAPLHEGARKYYREAAMDQ